jgi:hypothetical protein
VHAQADLVEIDGLRPRLLVLGQMQQGVQGLVEKRPRLAVCPVVGRPCASL